MKKNLKLSLTLFSLIILFAIKSYAQLPAAYQNGYFYSDNSNGRIYWCFMGRLHHVQSMNTYQGLFTKPDNYKVNVASIPYESQFLPLVEDCGLINDINTGTVYFRRSNYIHKINDANAFNSYHFNWGAITNVNGIGGYTQRGPIPMNYVTMYEWSNSPTY